MEELVQWLSTLGPWGVVAALVVVIVAPKLRAFLAARFPGLKIPSTPAVPSAPQAPATGLVAGLLEAIRAKLKKVKADADPDEALAGILFRELTYGYVCNPAPDPAPDPDEVKQ